MKLSYFVTSIIVFIIVSVYSVNQIVASIDNFTDSITGGDESSISSPLNFYCGLNK